MRICTPAPNSSSPAVTPAGRPPASRTGTGQGDQTCRDWPAQGQSPPGHLWKRSAIMSCEAELELIQEIRANLETGAISEAVLDTDERVLARITNGIYQQPASAIR